jgi:Arc/MetJ-type ribon-helix-helix transcriptional regulator
MMTVSGERTRRTVNFTPADQSLLAAVDQLIQDQQYGSFSDVCKQALRLLVNRIEPDQAVKLFTQLQRQLAALELRVEAIEQRNGHGLDDRGQQFEMDLQTLKDAIEDLQQLRPKPEPPRKPKREIDPLIQHLSSLLDDF